MAAQLAERAVTMASLMKVGSVVLVCAWLVPVQALHAQAEPGEMCPRADYVAETPSAPLTLSGDVVHYSAEQASCWMDATRYRDAAKHAAWMALDVREDGAAARAPLHGTTAVPLPALADKTYWRLRPLLLVGTGVDLRLLTQACLTLRNRGFAQVRVWLGGARSWQRSGKYDTVTPHEAWLGSADGQWRIATVGLSPTQSASLPHPAALALPTQTSAQALEQAMQAHMLAHPMASQHQWLLVAADARQLQDLLAQWAQLQAQAQTPPSRPLAGLAGGWPAYQHYLAQQQSWATHAGRRLVRPCGS